MKMELEFNRILLEAAGVVPPKKSKEHPVENSNFLVMLNEKSAQRLLSPEFSPRCYSDAEREIQKKNWEIYDRGHAYYCRKEYRKAREQFLKIDEWYHESERFSVYRLRTYRKLVDRCVEEERYVGALWEMSELFRVCPNAANSDVRKWNKLLPEIKNKNPSFEAKEKELIPDLEPEFTVDSSALTFIAEFQEPRGHGCLGKDGENTHKEQYLSRFLPDSLPSITFDDNAENIECIDLARDNSLSLFACRNRVFFYESGMQSKLIFQWQTPNFWESRLNEVKQDNIQAAHLSGDGLRIYLACASGRIFVLNVKGEVEKIYQLPKQRWEYNWKSCPVSFLIEREGYLHVMVDQAVYIIRADALIRTVVLSTDSIKWFPEGFVHMVKNTIRFYSNAGTLRGVLAFKRKIIAACYRRDYFLVVTKGKSFVFKRDVKSWFVNEEYGPAEGENTFTKKKMPNGGGIGEEKTATWGEEDFDSYSRRVVPVVEPAIKFAEYLVRTFGDEKNARSVYMEAETCAESPKEILKLAESAWDTLGDVEYVKTIINKVARLPFSTDYLVKDFFSLAEYTALKVGDDALAKVVYKKSADVIVEPGELVSLAESVILYLQDRAWARLLLRTAEKRCGCPQDFISLSRSVFKHFKNSTWLKRLYKKAVEIAHYPGTFIELAEAVWHTLNDKEWAILLYKRAEIELQCCRDYISFAESVASVLGDINWAGKAYRCAEERTHGREDFSDLALSILENLNDLEYSKKISWKRKHG